MLLQGTVFDPSSAATPDGATAVANMGRANELIVAELHGKYFEQCYRGNVYLASTTTAGVVIPIASTLTPTYSLWNPAGSGKLLVPIVTLLAWNATTAVLGGLVWHSTTQAGAAVGSGAPFTAFGTGTATNANLGSAKTSAMKTGTGGTTTLTAAATFYRNMGLTITATTAIMTGLNWWTARDDWDGTGILQPGTAVHLLGSTAVAATLVVSTIYAEVPI